MEKHIKERLVGAIVLVAIVVIVVPELLTGPRERAPVAPPPEVAAPVRTVTIDLDSGAARDASAADRVGDPAVAGAASETPATPEGPPRGMVERAPTAAGAPDAGTAPASPATASSGTDASAPVAGPQGATSAPAGTSAPKSASPPNQAAASKPGAAAKTEGSKAQSGADGAAQPPSAAKLADASSGVAAPPKSASDAAARTADAKVASPAPEPKPAAPKPAPSTTPPRPAAPSTSASEGWVVQLGSFASRPNAERLVVELRSKGYAGFVSEFRGSGRVLYRVRVGPEQDRGRAEAIAQRLAREGKKGSIAPHP